MSLPECVETNECLGKCIGFHLSPILRLFLQSPLSPSHLRKFYKMNQLHEYDDFGLEDLPAVPLKSWKWDEMMEYNRKGFVSTFGKKDNIKSDRREQNAAKPLLPPTIMSPPLPNTIYTTEDKDENLPNELFFTRDNVTTTHHVPQIHVTSGADSYFFHEDGTEKESPSPLLSVVKPVRWTITRRIPLQLNAKVVVFNMSRNRYLSYRIVPAIPGRLQFEPDIGVLPPRSRGVVYVTVVGTSPNGPTEHSLKVVQDTLQQKDPFLIIATPVLSPLKEFPPTAAWPDTLRNMWTHFGSVKFPMADEQLVANFNVTPQLRVLMEKHGEINWSNRSNLWTLLSDLAHAIPLSQYILSDIEPELNLLKTVNYCPFVQNEPLKFFVCAKMRAYIDQSKANVTLRKEHTGFWIFMTFLTLFFSFACYSVLKI